MSKRNRKPGVNENFVMNRHLKLLKADKSSLSKLVERLNDEVGVAEASINFKKSRLDIAYDASVQNLEHVLEVVQLQSCEVSHDWWTNFKADWYHSTDKNTYDNAIYKPTCCNKLPPGADRK